MFADKANRHRNIVTAITTSKILFKSPEILVYFRVPPVKSDT
jgi:hypothetical protein